MSDEVAALVLRDNYRQNARARQRARAGRRRWRTCTPGSSARSSSRATSTVASRRCPTTKSSPTGAPPGSGSRCPSSRCCSPTPRSRSKDDVLATALPDDPDFAPVLVRVLPDRRARALRDRDRRAPAAARDHRRPRSSTAWSTAPGSTFAFRLAEETGATADEIVRAHEAARAVFGQSELWHDDRGARRRRSRSTRRPSMYLESRKMIERASRWFLRYRRRPLPVRGDVSSSSRRRVARITDVLPGLLRGSERESYDDETARLTDLGVPARPRRARRHARCAAHRARHHRPRGSNGPPGRGRRRALLRRRRPPRARLAPRPRRRAAARRPLAGALPARAARRHRCRAPPRHGRRSSTTTDPGFEPEHAFDVWVERRDATHRARARSSSTTSATHGVYDLATLSVALRETPRRSPDRSVSAKPSRVLSPG